MNHYDVAQSILVECYTAAVNNIWSGLLAHIVERSFRGEYPDGTAVAATAHLQGSAIEAGKTRNK